MIQKRLAKYSQVFPIGLLGSQTPAAVLKSRRAKHLKAYDSFAVFAGVPREPGAENLWIMNGLRIFQEPALLYLTGINQPGIVLVLNPRGPEKELLFLPPKDPKKEFWDGVRFGYNPEDGGNNADVRDLRQLTGIPSVYPLERLPEVLAGLVKTASKNYGYIYIHQYPTGSRFKQITTDSHWDFYKRVKSRIARQKKSFQLKSAAPLHLSLRLPLDNHHMRNVKEATKRTNAAFRETLRQWKHFNTENQLGQFLEYRLKHHSTYGLSFPTIVAAGANGATLHYLKNDEPLPKGRLVLLDFGARYGTLHADISRTLPISGTFNPMQRILYQIVLDALKFNQQRARAGITIRDLNTRVWEFLEDELKKRFIAKGGWVQRPYTEKPHGVSHLMGEQEHDGDPFKLYLDQHLEPGWQISNEPGLYGSFGIKLGGRTYEETLGIRIEDNLVIRKGACLNLSQNIPKEITILESLLKRGLTGSNTRIY